jgi:hypothetical protein
MRAIVRSLTTITTHRPLTGADNVDQHRPPAPPGDRDRIRQEGLVCEVGAAPPTAAIANSVHDAPAPQRVEINVTPLTLPQAPAASSRSGSPALSQ